MSESEIWDIVFKAISIAITLATLVSSIVLGRKVNSRKIKIDKHAYDENHKECNNGLLFKYLSISLTNVGNRNIEIKGAKIELNIHDKEFLNINLTNLNNKINIDESKNYEVYCSKIKKIIEDRKDAIRPNKKLTIYIYDSTNKKYKVKFKIKLLDILKQKNEEEKKTFLGTINTKNINK